MAEGMSVGSVVAKFQSDLSDFKKGVGEAKDGIGGFKDSMDGIIGTGAKMVGTLTLIGTAIVAAGTVLVKTFVDAAGEAEVQMVKVDALLAQTAKDMKYSTVTIEGNAGAIKSQTKEIDAQISANNRKLDIMELTGKAETAEYDKIKKATDALKVQSLQLEDTAVVENKSIQVKNKHALSQDQLRAAVDATSKSFIQLGFDDEDTAVAMAKSLKVTKDLTASQKEMTLAADFARLQSISIGDAQRLLQMAYMGNARVLKQYGIELEDNATKQDIFNKIQAIAGGQAQAYANTYKGSMEILNVEFTNLKELIGGWFLPAAVEVVRSITGIVTQIQAWGANGDNLNNIINQAKTIWSDFLNYIAPLTQWFTSTVLPLLQSIWAELSYFINAVVPPVIDIIKFLIFVIIIPFVQHLVQVWKENWTAISNVLTGIWEIIKGVVQVAAGIILGIITVLLDLITGRWSKAWDDAKHYLEMAWEGIKNILKGTIDFLFGWGELLVKNLVSPFEGAWEKIKGVMENIRNAIKEALDFSKRHSPSIMDIVNKGVEGVQDALGQIGITPITHNLAGVGAGGSQVIINLDGANITSPQVAEEYAELIGDQMIRKLSKTARTM